MHGILVTRRIFRYIGYAKIYRQDLQPRFTAKIYKWKFTKPISIEQSEHQHTCESSSRTIQWICEKFRNYTWEHFVCVSKSIIHACIHTQTVSLAKSHDPYTYPYTLLFSFIPTFVDCCGKHRCLPNCPVLTQTSFLMYCIVNNFVEVCEVSQMHVALIFWTSSQEKDKYQHYFSPSCCPVYLENFGANCLKITWSGCRVRVVVIFVLPVNRKPSHLWLSFSSNFWQGGNVLFLVSRLFSNSQWNVINITSPSC